MKGCGYRHFQPNTVLARILRSIVGRPEGAGTIPGESHTAASGDFSTTARRASGGKKLYGCHADGARGEETDQDKPDPATTLVLRPIDLAVDRAGGFAPLMAIWRCEGHERNGAVGRAFWP